MQGFFSVFLAQPSSAERQIEGLLRSRLPRPGRRITASAVLTDYSGIADQVQPAHPQRISDPQTKGIRDTRPLCRVAP